MRITSSLLQSEKLVEALLNRGVEGTLVKLLHTIVGLATVSMSGDFCMCLQDLIAAMSLEVISVAISQARCYP